MKKALLLLALLLTSCSQQEQTKTQYAIYCDSSYETEYKSCKCLNYSQMKKDLQDKEIVSISATNCSNSSSRHIHYCVVYKEKTNNE